MGGKSGGGGGGTQTTTNQPWAGLKPRLEAGYNRAQSEVLDRPLTFFEGSTVVPFSGETEQSLAQQTARAGGSPINQAAQGEIAKTLGGEYLLGGNPAYERMVGSAIRPLTRQFQEVTQPGIASGYTRGGRGGSNIASATSQDQALDTYLQNVGDVSSRLAYGNYADERGRMQNAVNQAPTLAQEDYRDISALRNVGQQREAQAGLNLDEQIARHAFAQNEPTNRLAQYMSLISSGSGGYGTQTTTGARQGGSSWTDVAGLGLQAAGIGAGLKKPTVICTEAHRQGFFDDELMAGDMAYAHHLDRTDPFIKAGYLVLAAPIVRLMKKSRKFCWFMSVLARPVAEEMAFRMKYRETGNKTGAAVLGLGEPLCRTIAKWMDPFRVEA